MYCFARLFHSQSKRISPCTVHELEHAIFAPRSGKSMLVPKLGGKSLQYFTNPCQYTTNTVVIVIDRRCCALPTERQGIITKQLLPLWDRGATAVSDGNSFRFRIRHRRATWPTTKKKRGDSRCKSERPPIVNLGLIIIKRDPWHRSKRVIMMMGKKIAAGVNVG